MKTNLALVILVLIFAHPAFASWTRKVSYVEMIFACDAKNQAPDLSQVGAVNIAVTPTANGREFRVDNKAFSLVANDVFFLGAGTLAPVKIGTLNEKPECNIEDAGEPAHPSWVSVELDTESKLDFSDTAGCELRNY